MIGLVIATHGNLGSALLEAVEMIIGPVRNARSVSIQREDSLEGIRDAIEQAIQDVGQDGQGVIIATDMFGGTPSNVSMTFLDPDRIDVVTGINLPMALKFFNSQESLSLAELTEILQAYGRQSIAMASEYLQR